MLYILKDGAWEFVAPVLTHLAGTSLMFLAVVTTASIGVLVCLFVLVCQWRAQAKKRRNAE